MKLDSFKEILLKKSQDNPNLQTLIKYIREDYLVEQVLESLEKMAASYSKKNPNAAILHYGANMDPETDPGMIHDALSHHASGYKAALGAKNPKVADQHMKQIFKIMHTGDKLTRDAANDHSHGKLKIEGIDPKPWERAGYPNQNNEGKFSTDTRGWARHGSDYSWLRSKPHEAYSNETKTHGHTGAYPLEEIKVNGKYIHVDPKQEYSGKFEPHEFDNHPVMAHGETPPKSHDASAHGKYIEDFENFHSNEGGINKYFDKVEARDPAEHEARGSVKSDPVHGEAPQSQPSNVIQEEVKAPEVKAPDTTQFNKPVEEMSQEEMMALITHLKNGGKV